ncbi:sensor histidine kinase [Sabulicella rubraurantiaca]|uniref:sensor histidine kinase n=1 Tax=Sabulicella rubraurantiaca TaxID=2811429 RepID=UPI001A975802|nr:PAS domain-containing sensor histidine kinase [Sabulicella rubraurantiaca]
MSAPELSELRRRLAEAEDTLRAIREGEVDALVVRSVEREQVFHLVGGDETYRAFMESMELGAAALDADGRLLYVNAALPGLLGVPAGMLESQGLLETLGVAGAALRDLLAPEQNCRRSAEVTLQLDGRQRHLLVTAAPLPLPYGEGHALTFTDITQRLDAVAREESERIGRAIMASAIEAVAVCDAQGIVSHASPAATQMLGVSPLGRPFSEAFPLAFAPGAGAMDAGDLVAVALRGGAARAMEATLRTAQRTRDILLSVSPLRKAGGAVGGCIVTLMDVSERRALEKRQELLMRELDHRMKNMLALVLSISARTLEGATGLQDFAERFTQRLSALAATQDLLAGKVLSGLSLQQLIAAEVAPYVSALSARISMQGLEVEVSRDAAVALGLVFHELVTNAVKYGALSNESGRVSILGQRLQDGGLEILWEEAGGPPVRPPARRGFGETVIARGLGQFAGGGTTVEYRPEGVTCRMLLTAESLG